MCVWCVYVLIHACECVRACGCVCARACVCVKVKVNGRPPRPQVPVAAVNTLTAGTNMAPFSPDNQSSY